MEPKALRDLVDELSRLPGIGPKSARRIAYHLLRQPGKTTRRLSEVILQLREKVVPCRKCFHVSEGGLCPICQDPEREAVVCVVEDVRDVFAIEKTGEFRGRYHVLNGAISPLDGIGPEDLTIGALVKRIEEGEFQEVILATNLTLEGEATAMYISRVLKPRGIRVYRIAHGLPVGASLEHADEATMAKALEGKKEI